MNEQRNPGFMKLPFPCFRDFLFCLWIFLSKNTTSVLCLQQSVSDQTLLLSVFIVIGSPVISFYMNSVLQAEREHRGGGSFSEPSVAAF